MLEMEQKERILKVAEELFLKFGIRNVTMDEIAAELGISKKTIYLHFEDKDAIVHEMAENIMQCDIEEGERVFRESRDPIEAVFKETELLKNNTALLNPTLVYDLKKYHPRTWELFQKHKQGTFLEMVRTNLKEGIKQGLYRNDINVEVLAALRMEEIEFAFDVKVFPPNQFNQIEIHTIFIDHFLRGVLTEKGLQIYESYKAIKP
jgi:AcrR family transcriptional regulator